MIKDALIRRKLLDGLALERVQRLEAESGERIDHIAAKLGLVAERDLVRVYADLLGSALVATAEFPSERVAEDRVQRSFVRHARVVPLQEDGESLTVAMADPFDDAAARALEFAVEKPVLRRAALPSDIESALERLWRGTLVIGRAGRGRR